MRVPVLAVLCLSALVPLGRSAAQEAPVWIRNVTVVSPERTEPARSMHVVLEDGRITSVSRETPNPAGNGTVIEGRGRFLIPGLIDSHVHLEDVPGLLRRHAEAHPDLVRAARAQFPRSYLYHGFTTLIDLNGDAGFIAEWNARDIRPDAYWCGGAPLANGYPTHFIPVEKRFRARPYTLWDDRQAGDLPAGIDPARHSPEAVVRRMRADGARCVKTFFETGFGGVSDLPVPTVEMIRAVVREADRHAMPVAVHANSEIAQGFVLETGAGVIAHGLWHWSERSRSEPAPGLLGLLDRIAESGTGYQATMQVIYAELDLLTPGYLDNPLLTHVLPEPLIAWYRTAEGQWFRDRLFRIYGEPEDPAAAAAPVIRRLEQSIAGLAERDTRFLFGSDTPSGPLYTNPPGLNGRLEIARLNDAGLTPRRIFKAATLDNAVAFGLAGEIGTVETGKKANLLLLASNPLESVDAYDTIETVIIGGKPVARADLSAARKR